MEKMITGKTVLTGLIGKPVAHSISPMMHNEAFRYLGLDYVYLAFDVESEKLNAAVEGLKVLGVKGFNVTMPHKNQVCTLVDSLSPAARLGGAVNTVLNENGRLKGFTTDGKGFMRAVESDGLNLEGEKMTLLGAGGAGVSIMVQAALDGVEEISVFNSKSPFYYRAEKIIDELKNETGCRIKIYDYDDPTRLNREIDDSKILVNATSVGMSPNLEQCIIKDFSILRKDLYVFDAIYEPRETMLLKEAAQCGCRVQNGLNMLLYQGAESFKIWTGKEMPVEWIKERIFKSA